MKRLSVSDAIAQAASELQTAALGKRYVATVQSVTDRETTGWVVCDVFFRDPAADGRVTVRVNEAVDLAASDLIYIKPDPAGQKTFIFDGFVKGGGTGNNDAGAFIPWTQAPGATSPVGMDYNITPAAGQSVVVDGVNWSTFAALEFVLMSADAAVANERVLTGGDGVSLTDGGAGGAATLAVDLVAAWSGLEFVSGELRIDLDAEFDPLNTQAVIFGGASGANFIMMPDNVANALQIATASDEYLGFRSAAQREAVFNEGGADIDFRVEAAGQPNALFVRGSDGRVSASYDTDQASFFGRAAVGYCGSSDYAAFAHLDMNTSTSYALLQFNDGTTFFNTADTKAIEFRINNVGIMGMVATAFYPVANKTIFLGLATNRWATVYASNALSTGTSRLTSSSKRCPVCDAKMVRGTGGLRVLGETEDYLLIFCPDCGNAAMEKVNHLPESKLGERLPPPRVILQGIRVIEDSGRSRSVQVTFKYGEGKPDATGNAQEILNSTYLSDAELALFQAMVPSERKQFLLDLGRREWESIEELRLMRKENEHEQMALSSLVKDWVGTDLLH